LNNSQKLIWVFTDDALHAHAILEEIGCSFKIIDAERLLTAFETLMLISSAKTIVISNSTFAWWGAYFSQNAEIYCPSKWFQKMSDPIDLIPQNWIQIESRWV